MVMICLNQPIQLLPVTMEQDSKRSQVKQTAAMLAVANGHMDVANMLNLSKPVSALLILIGKQIIADYYL